MFIVFVYVNVVYAAVDPASKFWEERKQAAARLTGLRQSADSNPPALLAQIPGVDFNLLPQASHNHQTLVPFPGLSSPASRPTIKIANQPLPKCLESIPASYVSIKDLYLPPSWKPGDMMIV